MSERPARHARGLAIAAIVLGALATTARAEQSWPELDPPRPRRERDRSAQIALDRARPELAACLEGGGAPRLYVQARISPRHPMRIVVGPRSLPAPIVECAEAAARRWLVPLAARSPAPFSIARVELRAPPAISRSVP